MIPLMEDPGGGGEGGGVHGDPSRPMDYIRKPYECVGKYRNITHVSVLCGIISGNLMSVEVNTET